MPSGNMTQTVVFTAVLRLHATYCTRMFDASKQDELSQVFMPFVNMSPKDLALLPTAIVSASTMLFPTHSSKALVS